MFHHIDNKNTNPIDPWWIYAQFASIRPIKDIDQFDNLWLLFKSYFLEIYSTHTGQPATHPKKSIPYIPAWCVTGDETATVCKHEG